MKMRVFDFNKRFWFGFGGAFLFVAVALFAPFLTGAQTTKTAAQSSGQRPRQTPTPPVLLRQTPAATPTPATGGEVIEDDGETIRIDNQLVNLSVRVIDRNSKVQGDIRPEEFKVFEDGVEQKIQFVSREQVPVNYGLVVDNSGSLRSQLEKVIEAGKTIVGANKDGDETFIIRFVSSDKIEISQDFTNDKNALNDALDEFHVDGGSTAIIDAVMLASEKTAEYEKSLKPDDRKRRALILVTDGEDRASYYKEEQLFAQLREADVQIYTIGFVKELDTEKSLFGKSDKQKAVNLLERMAKETGGKAYFPDSTADLAQIARDITNELRTQYIVSYVPTNDKNDGTYRTIKVQIADDTKRGKRIPLTRSGRTAAKQ